MPRTASPPIQGSVLRWKSRQLRPPGWIRLDAIVSGMVIRPVTLSPPFSALSSLSSCTACSVGLNESWAAAGNAPANNTARVRQSGLRIERRLGIGAMTFQFTVTSRCRG